MNGRQSWAANYRLSVTIYPEEGWFLDLAFYRKKHDQTTEHFKYLDFCPERSKAQSDEFLFPTDCPLNATNSWTVQLCTWHTHILL